MKVLTAKVKNLQELVSAHLMLLNGLLRLTDTELKVLSELVWEYYRLQRKQVLQPALSAHVFNSDTKNNIREKLSSEKTLSVQHFNNIMKSLRDKGMIVSPDGMFYDFDQRLLPDKVVTFKYEIEDEDIDA